MKRSLIVVALAAALSVLSGSALSADPVKIGMVTTLSTKAGYLGEDIRDGFKLAMDQAGGKLGGVPVELMVDDDGRKPDKGKQIADRYMKRDGVKIMTGIVFSKDFVSSASTGNSPRRRNASVKSQALASSRSRNSCTSVRSSSSRVVRPSLAHIRSK